jgi:hypothetical protein
VRALESAARGPLSGVTSLRIGPDTQLLVVDGILTNLHGPGQSHFELLESFADHDFLEEAWDTADRLGLQEHEFGDEMLVLPARSRGRSAPRPELAGETTRSPPNSRPLPQSTSRFPIYGLAVA